MKREEQIAAEGVASDEFLDALFAEAHEDERDGAETRIFSTKQEIALNELQGEL
jgi:hypothetical protein